MINCQLLALTPALTGHIVVSLVLRASQLLSLVVRLQVLSHSKRFAQLRVRQGEHTVAGERL